MPNTLPPKEQNLFKRVLKCYEQKQYKNGLKFAKQILVNPKYSEHGETLAMKGLILNCLGRKEEAFEFVKKGLRNDLTSHVCWHVYGLVQRAYRKYEEAIKCYRNALKFDKENLQILRDLSLLQVQMRDLEGYRETRYQLLKLRAGQRQSWIGYAISHHLIKDYNMAYKILEEFSKSQTITKVDNEHCEMLLYQNMIIRESGKLSDALEHLTTHERQITDKLAITELKALINLELGNFMEAEQYYWKLLNRNPENVGYYHKLEKSIQPKNVVERMKIYKRMEEKFPRAQCPKRLPLNFLSGSEFTEKLDLYMRSAIRKGVPPLFVNLRSLYNNSEKVKIVEENVLKYEKYLLKQSSFDENESTLESPTVLLWTQCYLAQHYDILGNTQLALDYIDKALEHTPTLIEAYMIKARIFKHGGDMKQAAYWMDEARSLDTADRYVNSKCAKYQLRANEIAKAERTCGLFTREGSLASENLNEMQCIWYETECGRAYKRLGNYGEALKKCHEIEKHFEEITEDQFDFHSYCLRKMTLCAYVRLLRLEDSLRGHHFYFKAAKLAIECYIELYDRPLCGNNEDLLTNNDNLSEKDLKKKKSKQRRAAKKAEIQQEKNKDSCQKNEGSEESKINANNLAKVEDPLTEAVRFLKPLQTFCGDNMETHVLAFEIYYRKDKLLLMLQSLKRAVIVDPTHPKLHECLVKFSKKVSERKNIEAVIKEVINKETKPLYHGLELLDFNKEFLNKHKHSLPHQLAGAAMLYFLDTTAQTEAITMATSLHNEMSNRTLEVCSDVLLALETGRFGECQEQLNEYRKKCRALFPYSLLFISSEQHDDLINTKPKHELVTCNGNNLHS
ncbi:N-alpha-acetyltransferase 15, NatA auxiliary subunit-like [Xenia sp. Carnegie-2017]|uniref:N-alpha-acetyltransferase 15, NatA auxiliary subunit-like n=1 Tax=Xenia sp. Carnegie-2017 TaxID=2897299 RepID=UPI001F04B0EF|nr:N-alpha-acetyltransferase 15, NatA auxiliary subunit-like [Xenia sp. Carnegie-2017]